MGKVKLVGMKELEKQLKKNASKSEVKSIIKKQGAQLQANAQREADFKGHYEWVKGKGMVFKPPTGNLKREIKLDIKDGGMTAEVYSEAEYAPYVELGTRFMEAQPFLKPALEKQETSFKKEMRELTE